MGYVVKPLVTEKMTAVSEKQNNTFGFIVLPPIRLRLKKKLKLSITLT